MPTVRCRRGRRARWRAFCARRALPERFSTMLPRAVSDALLPLVRLLFIYVLIHTWLRGNTIWDQWYDGQGNCCLRRTGRGRGFFGAGDGVASGAAPRGRPRREPGDGRDGVQGT